MFRKRGVESGDYIYIVTNLHGKLYVSARLRVDRIVSYSQAKRELGQNIWKAKDQILATDGTKWNSNAQVPDVHARALRFGDGQPLRFKSPGVLDQQTLRGLRQLSPESAKLLDGVLGIQNLSSETNTSSGLRRKVSKNIDAYADGIVTFHDRPGRSDHARFQAWRRTHSDGFLMNCQTRRKWMLHRVACEHLGDVFWSAKDGHSLTKTRKLCSSACHILQHWAETNGVPEVKCCSDCLPNGPPPILEKSIEDIAASLDATNEFDPESEIDGKEHALASIVRRQGQPRFRQQLLHLYGGACAITGTCLEPVLEAAHILPYNGPMTNHPQNGILLRADLHVLFDRKLISIDPDGLTVIVSERLMGTYYEQYHGKKVAVPIDTGYNINLDAVRKRNERASNQSL
jgi:hypothetical protein